MSVDPSAVVVDSGLIFPDLEGRTREEVLGEMALRLAQAGVVRDAADLSRRLIEREGLGCTGLGNGIAIPHCKLKELSDVVVSIGQCPRGVDFQAPDGVPVRVLFLVLSPVDAPALHLQALARVSRWLKTPGVAENLYRAQTREEIVDILKGTQANAAAARG